MQRSTHNHFPPALNALLTAEAYPHTVRAVELLETHVSWILLTGEYAYKIKRPVNYAFIDMRELERRAHFCREELRLNRRFAPDLYLEVCEITSTAGVARIAGSGRIIEYAVRMCEFDRNAELDRLLEQGAIEATELEAFGCALADIHAGLPIADPSQPWGRPSQVRDLILANLAECAQLAVVQPRSAELNSLLASLESTWQRVETCLMSRHTGGRIRECHGDLHSRNIVRRGNTLTAFDCMEFEPAFRWIDVAGEVAMLLADLDARGHAGHARAFLQGYLSQSGDYQACRVLALYKAHFALVRAKVAQLHSATAPTVAVQRALRAELARLVDRAMARPGWRSGSPRPSARWCCARISNENAGPDSQPMHTRVRCRTRVSIRRRPAPSCTRLSPAAPRMYWPAVTMPSWTRALRIAPIASASDRWQIALASTCDSSTAMHRALCCMSGSRSASVQARMRPRPTFGCWSCSSRASKRFGRMRG